MANEIRCQVWRLTPPSGPDWSYNPESGNYKHISGAEISSLFARETLPTTVKKLPSTSFPTNGALGFLVDAGVNPQDFYKLDPWSGE